MFGFRCRPVALSLAILFSLALAACAGMSSTGPGGRTLTLTGAEEVPPTSTPARATGRFTIAEDGAVSGSVTTTGITSTVAHLHNGAKGTNGPVILPLAKNGETYSAAPGAKLTPEQLAAYKAGNVYVNVHSAKYPGGEIRAQLVP
jgi:hypothetical protein